MTDVRLLTCWLEPDPSRDKSWALCSLVGVELAGTNQNVLAITRKRGQRVDPVLVCLRWLRDGRIQLLDVRAEVFDPCRNVSGNGLERSQLAEGMEDGFGIASLLRLLLN